MTGVRRDPPHLGFVERMRAATAYFFAEAPAANVGTGPTRAAGSEPVGGGRWLYAFVTPDDRDAFVARVEDARAIGVAELVRARFT